MWLMAGTSVNPLRKGSSMPQLQTLKGNQQLAQLRGKRENKSGPVRTTRNSSPASSTVQAKSPTLVPQQGAGDRPAPMTRGGSLTTAFTFPLQVFNPWGAQEERSTTGGTSLIGDVLLFFFFS